MFLTFFIYIYVTQLDLYFMYLNGYFLFWTVSTLPYGWDECVPYKKMLQIVMKNIIICVKKTEKCFFRPV